MRVICVLLMVLSVTLLSACTSARQSEELSLGKNTFNSGDFKLAFRRLLPLAVEGNPDAEYAVGYMYYYGYGVPQDSETGLFWMQRAADKGNSAAIKAVHTLNTDQHTPGTFVMR